MPRFCANLSMMFNEHPFLDRFAAAAGAGFTAVEFLFPYDHPAADIRTRLDEHGLEQVLFNMPPGDWSAGERGLASLPGRTEEFRAGVRRALEYAAVLGTKRLHCMAGLRPAGLAWDTAASLYATNLAWACEQAAPPASWSSSNRSPSGHAGFLPQHHGPRGRGGGGDRA